MAARECARYHAPYKQEGHGYVYVVAEAKPTDGMSTVKLGRTGRTPRQRLNELRRGTGRDLRLVYAVETAYNCLLEV